MAEGKQDKPDKPTPFPHQPPGLLKSMGPEYLHYMNDTGGRVAVDVGSVVSFQETGETTTLFLQGGHAITVTASYDEVRDDLQPDDDPAALDVVE